MTAFGDRLRIVPQFRSDEADKLRDILFGKLTSRLSRWQPEQVELELSVKERDTPSQRTVLECWISGAPKLVATSTESDINQAVIEVRDDLWNQINKHVTKAESARKR